MLYVALAIVAVAGLAWFLVRRASSVAAVAHCTYCDRPVHEVGPLVAGPVLRLGDTGKTVEVHVCGGCLASLDEVFAMDVDPADAKEAAPDEGPRCSHCGKGVRDAGRMALGARFYLVKGDGKPRIERVVHHALFMMAYGSKQPELLAELHICNGCAGDAKQLLSEPS